VVDIEEGRGAVVVRACVCVKLMQTGEINKELQLYDATKTSR
jgi:hypothetical protein